MRSANTSSYSVQQPALATQHTNVCSKVLDDFTLRRDLDG